MASEADLGARTRAVLHGLRAVKRVRPVDRERIEAAFATHLRALGEPPRPVTWVDADPSASALDLALAGILRARELLGLGKRDPLTDRLWYAEVTQGRRHATGVLADAHQALHGADRPVRHAARRAVQLAAKLAAPIITEINGPEVQAAAMEADHFLNPAMANNDVMRCSAAAKAAGLVTHGGGAITWSTAADAMEAAGSPSVAATLAALDAYLPLLDAVDAGLWLFWSGNEFLAVPVPPLG